MTIVSVEGAEPDTPAFSFQYLRMTGSMGTPSNSSVMHWTSKEVEWDLLPPAGIDISVGEKKVSGTRIMAGLCMCIWCSVFTYVGQSASCRNPRYEAACPHTWTVNTYLDQSNTTGVFVKSRHSDLSPDTASFEHGDDEAALRAARGGGSLGAGSSGTGECRPWTGHCCPRPRRGRTRGIWPGNRRHRLEVVVKKKPGRPMSSTDAYDINASRHEHVERMYLARRMRHHVGQVMVHGRLFSSHMQHRMILSSKA